MNTVILVSVLCTLGVVAIVTTVVVAFMRMNKKVDDRETSTNQEFERVYEYIKNEVVGMGRSMEDLHRTMEEQFRESYNDKDKAVDEIYRTIDSRCDKLDSKICGKNCKCNPTEKQLLTD